MIHNLKIVKVLPLIIFVMIILVSGLVLYQVKYFSKNIQVYSKLIGTIYFQSKIRLEFV